MAAVGLALTAALVLAGCADEGADAATTGSEPTSTAAPTTDPAPLSEPRSGAGVELQVGTDVAPPVRVAPPLGDPNDRIDRDAGISAQLSDGSTVWFFGDTGDRLADESLRYFVIGSASWSSAAERTVLHGGTVSGRVVPFATATPDFVPCPPEAPSPGMWPLSAVIDPTDANRVIIWMANICLGSGGTAVGRGISVGEWRYDPADPPLDRPITVQVLEQNLFQGDEFGEASLVDGDQILVYECRMPDDPELKSGSGACRAARVAPDRVADAAAYEMWDGTGWAAGSTSTAVPLDVAIGGTSDFVPPGAFSVAAAPGGEGYVMLYSPWPGYVPYLEIRGASSPQGPWSLPAKLDLPGCEETYRGRRVSCYSANVQPTFAEPGRLAFGYYDQYTSGPPQLGSYLLSSVGFELRTN